MGFSTNPYAIGYMQSYMKNIKLTQEFEKRKADPNAPKKNQVHREKNQLELEMERIREQAETAREGSKIGSLDVKLKAGGELTEEELSYLKEKSPELYAKAMEVKKEREQYKKALKRCRTKEDVERLNARTMHKFISEVKAVKENANMGQAKKLEALEQIGRRMMGIFDEHTKFIKSKEYQELPTEEEEEKKKVRRSSPEDTQWQQLMDHLKSSIANYRVPQDPMEADVQFAMAVDEGNSVESVVWSKTWIG